MRAIMAKIQAVAFDLEGTVIDVEFAHHEGHRLAAQDAGVILSVEDCFSQLPHFIGGPDDEVAREIAEIASRNSRHTVDYKEVLTCERSHYEQLLQDLPIQPRPGFVDFFNSIREMGLKYTVGSLTNEGQAKVLLERSGLADLFGYENIVLREHVKKVKPAPDVWVETARRASVNPDAQLVFEDSPRGIQGAIKIGAYCIGMPVYNRSDTITSLMDAGARRIFIQWDEINAPNLIKNINHERSERQK